MKNKIFILLTIVFTSVSFLNCGKSCSREECPNVKPGTFTFRILNNANQDLLAGTSKIYDTSQIKIKFRRAAGSSMEYTSLLFNKLNDTSILAGFSVDKSYYKYYLQINNAITDSMGFGYNSRFTACCDISSYYLSSFNTITITDFALPGTYFIRK
jgi:hypothetical protein